MKEHENRNLNGPCWVAGDQPHKTQLHGAGGVELRKASDATPFQQHRSKAGAIFGPLQGRFKALEQATESSYQSFIKASCSRTPTDLGLGQFDVVKRPRNSALSQQQSMESAHVDHLHLMLRPFYPQLHTVLCY
ncbi:hypothetical protein VULLAG_LOCUS9213 [Vulpes lagopus]